MSASWENSAVATGLEKVNFLSNIKEGQYQRCLNYCTVAHISHANKVMLKFLQARPQQHVKRELPKVQTGFQGGRGTRDQIANICGLWRTQGSSRKISTSASLTMLKP